jgi:DNA-binding LacI/PurR family transcriptional regulator
MQFVTPEQIAAEAGCSIRTVARDLAGASLRSRPLDNRRVLEAKDAAAYVERRKAARAALDALKRP